MADVRVYFGESFLCRAINPELAGETVALKDIIRARNRRRRELRTTLAEREATVEALLRLRRGEDTYPEPLFPESDPASTTTPEKLLQRVTSPELPSSPTEFIVTKEYRRFAEFCDACREARYIGLCYGLPGVGKTVSARRYAHWNQLEALLGGPPPYRHAPMPPHDSGPWQTVLYTPGVSNTPRSVEHAVGNLWAQSTASRPALRGSAIQTQRR
jgi:hypothetical protein